MKKVILLLIAVTLISCSKDEIVAGEDEFELVGSIWQCDTIPGVKYEIIFSSSKIAQLHESRGDYWSRTTICNYSTESFSDGSISISFKTNSGFIIDNYGIKYGIVAYKIRSDKKYMDARIDTELEIEFVRTKK